MTFTDDKNLAEKLDSEDALKDHRSRFFIPKNKNGNDVIYLCGNSLGLQPKSVRNFVEQELKDWEMLGVEGHFYAKNPWMPYHELLTEQTARLVGAKPIEVVVMNTLTVNLHLMLVSFYRPTTLRHKIVIEAHAFPSDRYAVESQIRFHGFDPKLSLIELQPRAGETILRTEDIEDVLDADGDEIAVVLIGGVNYYTGQVFDMERITTAGQAQGCVVGFDLAHAAGNIPLKLHEWNVDFAVWCSYKYLNAGPGNIAGCFVHERHATNQAIPRFTGWWGQNKNIRFNMGPTFDPIPGAEGWQLSNPPILPLAALRASLEIFDEVGMETLREKSVRLTSYLEYLLNNHPSKMFSIITPADSAQRGCQLSIRTKEGGKKIFDHLMANGVVCDWREPDVIRVAPVPLYNSFTDVFRFVEILASGTEAGG
ncbi:kynureninase [Sphingobacteriales bacterium CHB3]|nr:kynureninase [Sphingobacteriales bacterium CHB3]